LAHAGSAKWQKNDRRPVDCITSGLAAGGHEVAQSGARHCAGAGVPPGGNE